MKKLILLLLVILMAVLMAQPEPMYKEVKYSVPAGRISYVNLLYAKPYGNNFIIYADLFSRDSSIVANNAYFLDTKAPFALSSQAELDSLLAWRK